MTCSRIIITVVVLLLLRTAAAASGPGEREFHHQQRAFIIAASPGTNTSAVRAVLQAAGVWLALPGSTSACEQLQLHASPTHHRLPSSSSSPASQQRPGGNARAQLTHSCQKAISGVTAAAPPDATGWALQVDAAAAHSIASLLPPHAHILHVVQDVEQLSQQQQQPAQQVRNHATAQAAGAHGLAVPAEHWARTNLGLKAWATLSGLGIARRYSIARREDLCSRDAGATETAVHALLQHAGLAPPASTAALLATLAQLCAASSGSSSLSSAAAAAAVLTPPHNSSGVLLYSALTAFDYKPVLPIGLPGWLAAPQAMAELARVAASWPPSSGPAVITFVSDGYEPLLNNWLAWVKASGASLARVLVITGTGNVQHVQRKLLFKSVRVIGMDPLEPEESAVLPGSSEALGRASDPNRNKRARVWLLRVRVMYELVAAGVGVVVSDLDAIWRRDAVADLLARLPAAVELPPQTPTGASADGAASSIAGRQGGSYDLLMSPGFFPFDIHEQMGVAGCMGFLFARPTPAAQRLLGAMLLEKLGQLQLRRVKFFNDQRVLNEQLLLANIAVNSSMLPGVLQPAAGGSVQQSSSSRSSSRGSPTHAVEGTKLSTAPDALRVLFLPDRQYARVCSANASAYTDAVVVHCQSHNSGPGKMTFLHEVGLWKEPAAAPSAAI